MTEQKMHDFHMRHTGYILRKRLDEMCDYWIKEGRKKSDFVEIVREVTKEWLRREQFKR